MPQHCRLCNGQSMVLWQPCHCWTSACRKWPLIRHSSWMWERPLIINVFDVVEGHLLGLRCLKACWLAGNLALTLDPQSEQPCFSAEVYAHEMGLADEMDDTKLTYALEMVRGLFSAWAAGHGVQPYELPGAAKPPDR